jgi:chromate transporter
MVEGLFFGLKAAVLAVVVQAVFRIGGRALKNNLMVGMAAAAFVAIFFFKVPFPLIVLVAGVVGFFGGRTGSALFTMGGGHKAGSGPILSEADSLLGETTPPHARPNIAWSLKMSAVLLALWIIPVAGLLLALGPDDVFTQISLFFSKMAVVTFGGAYAVLSYVAQQAVDHYHWLKPGEMLDGLGMAETTPGPLIQVVQFVGFLGAYRDPGSLGPLTAATFAAVLTTWVTYVPCFLWIFLGAPFVEKLRGNAALGGALSCITAAVVGVILNLAIWFALHTLFATVRTWTAGPLVLDVPVLSSVVIPSLVLSTAAAVAIFRFKVSAITTLLACASLGVFWRILA